MYRARRSRRPWAGGSRSRAPARAASRTGTRSPTCRSGASLAASFLSEPWRYCAIRMARHQGFVSPQPWHHSAPVTTRSLRGHSEVNRGPAGERACPRPYNLVDSRRRSEARRGPEPPTPAPAAPTRLVAGDRRRTARQARPAGRPEAPRRHRVDVRQVGTRHPPAAWRQPPAPLRPLRGHRRGTGARAAIAPGGDTRRHATTNLPPRPRGRYRRCRHLCSGALATAVRRASSATPNRPPDRQRA